MLNGKIRGRKKEKDLEEKEEEEEKEAEEEEEEEPSKSRTEPSGMPGVAPELFHLFPSLFLSLLPWSATEMEMAAGPLTEGYLLERCEGGGWFESGTAVAGNGSKAPLTRIPFKLARDQDDSALSLISKQPRDFHVRAWKQPPPSASTMEKTPQLDFSID
ncbi:hypothetical protein M0804_007765 [Polistes exclamans]|nr:hypothetical protein M0804_007765 [Polistes exclamans]